MKHGVEAFLLPLFWQFEFEDHRVDHLLYEEWAISFRGELWEGV
jgi:hypothetical protein